MTVHHPQESPNPAALHRRVAMSRVSPPTDAASLSGAARTAPGWARVLLLAATLMVAACGSGNGDDREPDENTAPTARAGTDQTANPGATVTLDGSASSDSESTTLGYSWQFTPTREDVTLSSTSTVEPTFTAPSVTEDADLIFTLTVTDAGGLTDTDTVTVAINAPPTAVPAGPGESVSSHAPVTIDGSGSTDAVRYAWRQVQVGSEPTITLGDTDGATLIFTAPTVATETTFTFELEVTDADGATHAARVEVVVAASETPGPGPRPANQAPTADAGEGGAVNAGTVVTLNGLDSKDPEGGNLDYSWTQQSPAMPTIELSGENAAMATFTAPTVTENTTFVFQLEVTDDGGLTATDEVSITVSNTVLSMIPLVSEH